MFEFSVIIPTYNRRENLYLTLCALDKARVHYGKPVELIVMDDGSTDRSLDVMLEFQNRFALQYRWQPHEGYRVALARNRGCAIARGRSFLFIDSDMLVDATAFVHLSNISKANPTAIVAGRYDWLLPMQISAFDVYNNWKKLIAGNLPVKACDDVKGIVGVDPRFKRHGARLFKSSVLRESYATSLYSALLMYPRDVYETLGGYDENFIGHGGEDCEMGIRAQKAGYKAIFSGYVHGYHVYHDRNQLANQTSCNAHVRYIASKHDLTSLGLYVWEVGDDIGILPIGEKPSD